MRKKKFNKGARKDSGNGVIPSNGLPNIGAPFGTMVRPSAPRLNLNGSQSELDSPTAAMVRVLIALVPPFDDQQSFGKQMNEWYMRMRAVNSGATNYSTNVLAAYFTNVRVLRTLHRQAVTALQALMANEPEYVNNAAALYYLTGGNAYHADSLEAAAYQNKLINLGKEIEALPIPDFGILRNDAVALGSVVREKRGKRASYAYPLVSEVYYCSLVNSDGVLVPNPTQITFTVTATSSGQRIPELINAMDTILQTMSSTFIFSTLRGDMVKTYGLAAYKLDLLAYMQAGLHVTDGVMPNKMLKNATFFALRAPTVSWDDTNSEFTVISSPIAGGSGIRYPGDDNSLYCVDEDSGTMEELYWYSMFCMARDATTQKAYQRGYYMRNIIALANGSVSASGSRFIFGTELKEAQTSTIQSRAEEAHTNLANLAALWESCPAYCPRGSIGTVVWHIDNLQIYTRADLLNLIVQAIRMDMDSKAFVSQSRAAQKN